jgi:amyloid beta precursor protein binding protein 1
LCHQDIEHILTHEPDYFLSFNIIIAHNINPTLVSKLSALLEGTSPTVPLIVIRSAGFLAEFFTQFQEHASK